MHAFFKKNEKKRSNVTKIEGKRLKRFFTSVRGARPSEICVEIYKN